MGTNCKDNVKPYWQDEKDGLYTVEFVLVDHSKARFYAADIIGYLLGYAQLTKTHSLARLGNPDASALGNNGTRLWMPPSLAATTHRN